MVNAFNRLDEQRRNLQQFKNGIAAHPFLSIGFGLYWMQTVLLFQSPYLFLDPSPLAGLSSLPKGTIVLVASVFTYVLWSMRYRHVNRISEARWFPIALCGALVLGALLYCLYPSLLSGNRDLAVLTYLTGSILIGCGTANICLETGRVFGFLGPLQVLFHGSAALLIGTFGALALSAFPGEVGRVALVLMPVPMVACLWKSIRGLPARELYGQGMQIEVRVPTKFLVTSFFQGLGLGVMHSFLISSFGSSTIVVSMGYLAAVVLLFFCAVAVKNNFDALIYRIGFPLMASGFFIVSMLEPALFVGVLGLDAGYCFLYLMQCSLCAYLAKGLGQPPIWIIGTGTACLLAGQFVGSVVDVLVPDWHALAIFTAFVLLLAALFMTSSRNIRLGWGAVSPGASAPSTGSENGLAVACQMLATEHRLSKRETEVFDLVVKGYSRKAIARELNIAEETVKTHSGRIYQKFLVHSKQELIELVAQRATAMDN
ncbi:response regulator transcription factor [Enteroscipio rubneri]|uniref:response regulator transcription factor n=1 Tax=Enteroscipio rubneri TaxID=2070686 RepID=UPI0012FFD64D|nr:LuxR family transcriptional regulator [Enteroscipio rubneri]